jgi:hypothetical protein
MNHIMRRLPQSVILLIGLMSAGFVHAQAAVYRCPGNNFTNSISPKEAQTRGCKPVEGGNVTVVSTPRPPAAAPATGPARRPGDRVDPAEQRARDSDARRILEDELRKEQDALAALQKEYNNGEPERQGNERNYQKYLDRVSELKASITRKESDIEAIKRELGKQPQAQ